MGTSGSKSAGRTYEAAKQAAAQVNQAAGVQAIETAPKGVVLDLQRGPAAERPRSLTLEEEEALDVRDADLGGLLDRLGGAIHGRRVDVSPLKPLRTTPRPLSSAEENAQRLPSEALKELYALQAQAAGQPPDIAHLLRKYKCDPEVVDLVLRYTSAPKITEAPGSSGVQGVAGWPPWFARQRAGNRRQ